jgi:hypothetical protein
MVLHTTPTEMPGRTMAIVDATASKDVKYALGFA